MLQAPLRSGGQRRAHAAARALVSPNAGVIGRGVRFAFSGGLVAAVYVGTTTLLADGAGLQFQVALLVGTVVAILVHFNLQRLFVWRHDDEFALRLRHQVGGYLLVACAQYSLTALSTWLLPSYLGLSTSVVYVGTVIVISCINFLIFRHLIFHPRSAFDAAERAGGASSP